MASIEAEAEEIDAESREEYLESEGYAKMKSKMEAMQIELKELTTKPEDKLASSAHDVLNNTFNFDWATLSANDKTGLAPVLHGIVLMLGKVMTQQQQIITKQTKMEKDIEMLGKSSRSFYPTEKKTHKFESKEERKMGDGKEGKLESKTELKTSSHAKMKAAMLAKVEMDLNKDVENRKTIKFPKSQGNLQQQMFAFSSSKPQSHLKS
eukprot:CAMPEP_0167746468 /NCGR_PEP_ID=MMETSP0110_2-20121227/3728_1 /TAXON_ID=629695 /ORGANISM="Gymnochlora sp., Strain CCMP2014" /LENGTH=208 /DNA_ID=CAMNT_0007631233 /DNA_START=26 /DNA_END=649 /DNA_ORIENTATION=-